MGAVVLVAGGYAYDRVAPGAAAVGLLAIYVLHNLRKPIGVAAISRQVESRLAASTLSAEAQATTLLQAALAPVLGLLADAFGIGVALAALGAGMALSAPLVWCRR